MASTTSFFDAPGGIKTEGNNQTLTFQRNADGTGTVCWSPVPPSPSTGCGTPSGHYAGGVLVGSTQPIEESEKPRDGVCCYKGDPTFDNASFAGDTLGGARVLWSSNTDKTTGCITVDGLDPTCSAYYFAFFAIDNTCRYNRDGIYSYSLPWAGPKIDCTPAKISVSLNGAETTDILPTSYDPTVNYTVKLTVDEHPLNLILRGTRMRTYEDVVDELNVAWKNVIPAYEGEYPPFYGQIYTDGIKWLQFDGERYFEIFPIISGTDPTVFSEGDLWYNPTTLILQEIIGGVWVPVSGTIIRLNTDPTIPGSGSLWFDGTTVRQFDGTIWLAVDSYSSSTDPALPPELTGNTFWLTGGVFYKWNPSRNCWKGANVLQYGGDINLIANGTLWYNPVETTLAMWNGLDWIPLPATIMIDQPLTGTSGQYWVNPVSRVVSRYNLLTTTWEVQPAIVWHKQPDEFAAGDYFYNTTTETLFVYDGLASVWVDITASLYTTEEDPAKPEEINDGAVWYNTGSNMWFIRSGSQWNGVVVVETATDPRTLTEGFWYNTTTNLWYERVGAAWNPISPRIEGIDPMTPMLGTTWYNGTTLAQWGTDNQWTAIPFATTLVENPIGSRWIDLNGTLHGWTGTDWAIIEPPYVASFNDKGCIVLTTTSCGGESMITIDETSFFDSVLKLIVNRPVLGGDSTTGVPMYAEIGVGTDGSADERRRVIHNLYTRLGAPTINVELTREQMNLAIDKAIEIMRRDSGAGYNRGYFFLDLEPGMQHYILTNKKVGFNKIVDILYLYRPRGSFLNMTFGGGDIYGQQMLQQLYVSGTFDLLSYHMLASYQTVVSKLFATEFQFQWVERTRTLSILRKIPRRERILVDATIERTEQDLLTDRLTMTWIENWALSEAKIMLGDMRGKFTSLPGAGGAISLNADALKAEAIAMQDKLMKELDDYNASDVETWGLGGTIGKG
jgi:hypothetical protein